MKSVESKCQYYRSARGFTLIELLVCISIIGILAVISLPSYHRYVNEAKAAELLSNVHDISIAFQDIIATKPELLTDHDALTSPSFGQAPPYLPGLRAVFAEIYGVSFSVQLVNHSNYFKHTGHEPFPVLFLKAHDDHSRAILNALDHVTELKHTFVSPSIMMMALAFPHEAYLANSQSATKPSSSTTASTHPKDTTDKHSANTPPRTSPCNPGFYLWPPESGQQYGTCRSTPPPTHTAVDQQASAQSSSGSSQHHNSPCNPGFYFWPPEAGQQYGTCHSSPPPSQTSVTETHTVAQQAHTSSSGHSAASQLNWPPGWVKHPWQHQNQHHGHH